MLVAKTRDLSSPKPAPGSGTSGAFSAADPLSHAHVLGLKVQDRLALADKVEGGFSYESFVRLQKATNLSREQLADLVQITLRTLTRRKSRGRLNQEESERLLRVARIFDLAVGLHEGDKSAARTWLERPNPALNGKIPFELARTEVGAREVEGLIARLEHGVFS
jgi:putative toxin-antitoxin system antitoxin component (TIGR02293 family)